MKLPLETHRSFKLCVERFLCPRRLCFWSVRVLTRLSELSRICQATRFGMTCRRNRETYCFDCHGPGLGRSWISAVTPPSPQSSKNYRVWEIVVERLTAEEMPQKTSTDTTDGTGSTKKSSSNGSTPFETFSRNDNAGDPGTVLARRREQCGI